MIAYSWTPKDGTNQLWITSVPVIWTRMMVSAGTTNGLSTSRSRFWPGFSSASGMMLLSKVSPPWSGYSYDQYQHRDNSPQHLDHGIVGGARGHGIAAVIEAPDHPGEQAQHKGGDQRDDDQKCVVKCRQAIVDLGGRGLHAELPGPWFRCPRNSGNAYRPERKREARPSFLFQPCLQPQHAPAASHPSRATRSSVPRGAFRAEPHTSHRSTKLWRGNALGPRTQDEIYTKARASDNRVNLVPTRCDEPPHAPPGAIAPFAPDGIGPY